MLPTMSTSSLQRTLQKSRGVTRPQYETSNGNFESSFANGLDLSEFTTSTGGGNDSTTVAPSSTTATTTKPKKVSAAAELLRIKQLEMEKQRQDEIEEKIMEEKIIRRAETLKKSIVLKRDHGRVGGGQNNVLVDALVKMHKGDISASIISSSSSTSSSQRRMSKKVTKSITNTRRGSNNHDKRHVHKKSRRNTKY